jgi:hypothetical protein
MEEPTRPAADGGPETGEDEARRKHDESQAFLGAQIERAREQFAYNFRLAEARGAEAERALGEVRALLGQLGGPSGPETADRRALTLAGRVYACLRRLLGLECELQRENLRRLEAPGAELSFRLPEREPHYLEARALLDLHLAQFLAWGLRDGLDAIARAQDGLPVVSGQGEGEARRAAIADRLRAACGRSPELAAQVEALARELRALFGLLEWAKASLGQLGALGEEARLAQLAQGRWGELGDKVSWLAGLPGLAAGWPELAGLFPQGEAVSLPYAPVSWRDASDVPGQTGRLNATGRLPQGLTGGLARGGPDA